MLHTYRAGNVLYLKTERESSSYFNLIKAASGGQNTFVLAGDGTLQMYKVRQHAGFVSLGSENISSASGSRVCERTSTYEAAAT